MRETDPLLKAVQNAITANHIKSRMVKTQKTKKNNKKKTPQKTLKKTPASLGYVVIETKQSIT